MNESYSDLCARRDKIKERWLHLQAKQELLLKQLKDDYQCDDLQQAEIQLKSLEELRDVNKLKTQKLLVKLENELSNAEDRLKSE